MLTRLAQGSPVGSPRAIFRRPRNRFVAEFIGETNLFDVTVDRIDGNTALARTAQGLDFLLPSTALTPGQSTTIVLRPADFRLAETGIPVTITRALYLGQDLHLFACPDAGGPEIRVTARDGADAPEVGTRAHLAHDPAAVHVLETT